MIKSAQAIHKQTQHFKATRATSSKTKCTALKQSMTIRAQFGHGNSCSLHKQNLFNEKTRNTHLVYFWRWVTMAKRHTVQFDTGLSRTGRKENKKQSPQQLVQHMHNTCNIYLKTLAAFEMPYFLTTQQEKAVSERIGCPNHQYS